MKEVIIQKDEHGNISNSLDYISRFNLDKKAKILDIGANYGSLIFNIYNEGYNNVNGIDINKEAISKGKKAYDKIKNKIKVYDGKKIPFKNNSFDVVLMFDVIEHIPNVQEFLEKEVYRVLKKGGIFIFQTPNKPINILWTYFYTLNPLNKWWTEHCSLQTYFSLKKILRNANFHNIFIEKFNIYTEHNINKVKKRIGFIAKPVLKILSNLPLIIYPNFYGYCTKGEDI